MTNQRAVKCMVRGEKYIKIIEMFIIGSIILLLVALGSGKLYGVIGIWIEKIWKQIIGGLAALLVVVVIAKYALGVYNGNYFRKSEKVWRNILKGTDSKVLLYLQNNRNKVPISTLLQLIAIYSADDKIFSMLLKEGVELYKKGDESTKSILSLILLKNVGHNAVTILFSDDRELRIECEEISKEYSDSLKNDFDNLQEAVTEKGLLNFFRKLLHCCLPSNSINKEEFIIHLKYIFAWILQNITKENIDSHQESMLTFILLLPAIKNKMSENNINDEEIAKSIHKIEISEWFQYLLDKSYQYIDFNLCRNETVLVKNEFWVKYSYITSMYYEKMNLRYKIRMLNKIKTIQEKLYKEYDPEKVVLFLLLASPIRVVKSDEDLLYNWLSLIYSCMNSLIGTSVESGN